MNKTIGLILTVIIVLALGVGVWFFIQKISIPEVEDLKELLPAKAMVFLEVEGLEQTWDKIKNTELYRLIDDLKKKALESKSDSDAQREFLDAKIKKLLEGEIINAFGKRGLIALYKPPVSDINKDVSAMLFITRINSFFYLKILIYSQP